LCLSQAGLAGEPDFAREKRLAGELVDAILDGDPVELVTDDGRPFLGIYTANNGEMPTKGTVVILHGRGFHPDWADVVQPLRVGLTEYGWNTLSIQLPVLAKAAKYYDYVKVFSDANPRIDAGLRFARDRDPGKVVLIAHSCGSHMAQHWLLSGGPVAAARIDAFVGIGMGATDLGQRMVEPFALDRLAVPSLDIYAEKDFPAVLRMAPERWQLMRRGGHPKNAQVRIPDAEHYFVDRGSALVDAIANWLADLW
jgi:pimeloyl-ACP methyl ester carboxylesterase